MIAFDDKDLFGGHISTVAAVEFCCQIETAGEGLHLAPVTAVHDLSQPGAGDVRPIVVLHYDAIWHSTNLSVPHKLLVNYLESLAEGDNRISLRQALEMAGLKFGYFGTWKWQPAAKELSEREDAARSHATLNPLWFAGGASSRRHADFHNHVDSPLAG